MTTPDWPTADRAYQAHHAACPPCRAAGTRPKTKKPATVLVAGFLYLTMVLVVGRTRFELVTNGLKGQLSLYESIVYDSATN